MVKENLMKILIVDDENISRKILASKMKGVGECVAVDNSKRALSVLKAAVKKGAPFDLITLDVSMPGMDGQEMLRYIRTNEIRDKVPKENRVKILMVTARMNMNTIKACIKAGCNGYLLKPVSRVQLMQNLAKIGVDTSGALAATGDETSHTAVVADIINRFYSGKIALPVFPHIVQEVQDLVASKDTSIDELGQIVEKDIVISSKLISIANSPLYRGMDTVDNLGAALLRLGMKTTQSVISAVAARHLFSSSNKPLKHELERLWVHSFATASLGKRIGEALGSQKNDNIFLLGIVHDIGKMLLMKAFMDICPEESISDQSLQMAIHEIHTTFGAALLKRMRFSQNFVHIVEFHHWNTFGAGSEQEMLILSVADHLAYELGYGFLRTAEHRIPDGQDLPQNQDGGPAEEMAATDIDARRTKSLERIGQLDALKHLGLSPEAVMAIGEQISPVIKETAKKF